MRYYIKKEPCYYIASSTGLSIFKAKDEKDTYLESLIRHAKTSFIKRVAHQKSPQRLSSVAINSFIELSIEHYIEQYVRHEELSRNHAEIARQPDSLPRMISVVLKEVLQELYINDLHSEILNLSELIYQNNESEIVYTRVSHVQKFVHSTVDAHQGENAHLKMSRKTMRPFLSAVRLHLNIHDARKLKEDEIRDSAIESPKKRRGFSSSTSSKCEAEQFVAILQRSKESSDNEKKNPLPVALPPSKQYLKKWRIAHLRSIFQENETCSVIEYLSKLLDIRYEEDLEQAKQKVIDLFEDYMVGLYGFPRYSSKRLDFPNLKDTKGGRFAKIKV